MSHSLTQEIGFVADALKHADQLEQLLEQKVTAAIRREIHALTSLLAGELLVADFALTGDEVGVRMGVEATHDKAMWALAA